LNAAEAHGTTPCAILVYHIDQPASGACLATCSDAPTTIPDNRLHNSSVAQDVVVSALGYSFAFPVFLQFRFFLL
jgi:hypothetical protein